MNIHPTAHSPVFNVVEYAHIVKHKGHERVVDQFGVALRHVTPENVVKFNRKCKQFMAELLGQRKKIREF